MITRIASAVGAVILTALIISFFQVQGLYVLCTLLVAGCIYEYSKLTLKMGEAPLHIQISFMLLAFVTYAATLVRPDYAGQIASLSAILLLAMLVIDVRRTPDLGQAFKLSSAALVGVFYVGLLPGFAVGLLGSPNGLVLFLGLLAIVFAGDTFAYFTGRFFGRRKLLEAVSPKKTIEGSVGGLVGSALVGFALAHYLQAARLDFTLIAIVSGAFAQLGDLFESLVKRLADVKDSGRIMPGHGGFLDRLDGVLFAGPVFYFLFHLLS